MPSGVFVSGFPPLMATLGGIVGGLQEEGRAEAWVGTVARHARPVEEGWQRGKTVVPPNPYFEIGLARVSRSLTDKDAEDIFSTITRRGTTGAFHVAQQAVTQIQLVIREKGIIKRGNLFFSIAAGETVEEMFINSRASMLDPSEALI